MKWAVWTIGCWAIACAICDVRQRRLPNALTFGGMAAGLGYALATGGSMLGESALSAAAAGTGALLIPLPLLRLGWLGAGDIKLMSAIGFLGGTRVLLTTFVFSSLLTLPVALWQAARHRTGAAARSPIPQGLFLALGLLLSLIGTGGSANP